MSQVYGISNAPTAILMYLAVLIYSPIMAAFAVLGATLGTLTGRVSAMPFSILVTVSSSLRVSEWVQTRISIRCYTCLDKNQSKLSLTKLSIKLNMKFWEYQSLYFPLILHGPHRKPKN
jgi:hypothetical protein